MRLAGPLTADQDRQLQRIQSAGGSLLVLINDVLDLAKWNQARSKLRGKKPPAAKS
jgi:protein-histidine pros-kinase